MVPNEHDPVMDACWEALDAWDGVEPSPTFRARVWERIRHEPRPQSWLETLRAWILQPRAAGLAAACLVLLLLALVSRTPAPPPVANEPADSPEVAAYLPEWDVEPVDVFPDLAEMTAEEKDEPTLPAEELGYVSDPWMNAAHEALAESL